MRLVSQREDEIVQSHIEYLMSEIEHLKQSEQFWRDKVLSQYGIINTEQVLSEDTVQMPVSSHAISWLKLKNKLEKASRHRDVPPTNEELDQRMPDTETFRVMAEEAAQELKNGL